MTIDRRLNWDGCSNVRDLGGLPTHDGRVTRWGALVRSDHPGKLSATGWSALSAHGIRSVLNLTTHGLPDELPDSAPRPAHLVSLEAAIEDVSDRSDPFVRHWAASELWCTPLYYRDALERWPERHAAALASITRAAPGGVLIHCKRGVDRTGIIALLLLAAVGVGPEAIIADYELSVDPERERILAQEQTSTRAVLQAVLDWLDIEAYLRQAGLSPLDLDALRTRLLVPAEH